MNTMAGLHHRARGLRSGRRLSSDLFRHGYFVRHWYHLGREKEVLEYNPRHSRLPRLTATCYAEQVEIHRALGLNLAPPGERWEDYGGRGLFDEVWVSE